MEITLEYVRENSTSQFIDCFEEAQIDGKKKFLCGVRNCKSALSEKSAAIRHLKKHHQEICTEVGAMKLRKKDMVDNPNIQQMFEIRVKVNINDIRNACVELITANALPIRIVEQPAFKKILQPYVTALQLRGIELNITVANIKKLITKRSKQIKSKIKSEVRNKLVCLMVDIATRYNRSVLGVSISFMADGKKIVRTIAMRPLRMSHTGENIVDMLKKDLSDLNISLRQVIAVTTDNGLNLIRMTSLLDALHSDMKSHSVEEDQNQIHEDDEEIDEDIFDHQYYFDLLTNVRELITDYDLVYGVSCAAHVFSLILKHAIDSCMEASQLIKKCREVVKKLRTPTIVKLIDAEKDPKLRRAKIDVETRWNSIYAMVGIFIS